VKVLIVDDHEIVRKGVSAIILSSNRDWVICGEGSDGAEAIELAKALKPDVVVLDVTMPGMNGLEAAYEISRLDLPSRILIFTMHDWEGLRNSIEQVGAKGWVKKANAARDLIAAIDALLAGGTFFGSDGPSSGPAKNPGGQVGAR
jgi:DNA-binding NarL/FixJ family response regulator